MNGSLLRFSLGKALLCLGVLAGLVSVFALTLPPWQPAVKACSGVNPPPPPPGPCEDGGAHEHVLDMDGGTESPCSDGGSGDSGPPDAAPDAPQGCARQLTCMTSIPQVYPIPVLSSEEAERAVRVQIPAAIFYDVFDRMQCETCTPQPLSGEIRITIDCTDAFPVGATSAGGGGPTFMTTLPIDPIACGVNGGVAEVDILFQRSLLGIGAEEIFEGGFCNVSAEAIVALDDGSEIAASCVETQLSWVNASPTNEELPMLNISTTDSLGDPTTSPVVTDPGTRPMTHVTVTNESPYPFEGRVDFSSENANHTASCSGATEVFSSAGESGDAFPGTTDEANRCFDLPHPSMSEGPTWQSPVFSLASGESITIPTFVGIWPGCFFGSASIVSACATGRFDGELAGKYRHMCVTRPVIVDIDAIGGDDTDPCKTDTQAVPVDPCASHPDCGGDPVSATDFDEDGLLNADEENVHFTDPESADTDRDGIDDGAEITMGTDPNRPDTDGDLLIDGAEITHGTNPLLRDTDGDMLTDYQETNRDMDLGTDPLVADTDEDGIPDGIEVRRDDLDPTMRNIMVGRPVTDSDGDGLLDSEEGGRAGDPMDPDSDDDGLSDGEETLIFMTGVLVADSDSDGLMDGAEALTHFSNPLEVDTDGDGLGDYVEVTTHGSSPNRSDTDRDGLDDGAEVMTHMTDPADPDSDDGGADDGREVAVELDPRDPSDDNRLINPTRGMVYITEETQGVRPVFYELGTEVTDLSVTDTLRTESPAGMFQGRITEALRVIPGSTTPGATHSVTVRYEADLLGNTGPSPLEITEIEIGLKPEGREPGSHTFVGEGRIQLSTSPYLNVLSMLQVAVWADGGLVGSPTPVSVADPMFRVAGNEVTLTFDITLPEHEFQRLILTHDFRGNQRAAFEVNCDDGSDNDGDGLIDCDDDSCDEHPACASTPDAGPSGPGGPGGDEGCGCTIPSSGNIGALGIAGVLGVLWWRRRRR